MSTVQITGEALAVFNKYTGFDPAKPTEAAVDRFIFIAPDQAKDFGGSYLAGEGYVIAGRATITIDLLPAKEMAAGAIDALKAQKAKIMADAQAEATKIEQQIQSLLALPFNGSEAT